jgi:hypothetical protein
VRVATERGIQIDVFQEGVYPPHLEKADESARAGVITGIARRAVMDHRRCGDLIRGSGADSRHIRGSICLPSTVREDGVEARGALGDRRIIASRGVGMMGLGVLGREEGRIGVRRGEGIRGLGRCRGAGTTA